LSSVKKKGGLTVDIRDQGWLNLYFVSYVPKYGTFLNAPTEKIIFDITPEPEVYHFRISHAEELFINKHT
jgi:hypothetical protein